MAIESNLAGVARVAFEAETGEFNRDVAAAEQRYKAATEHMSDSAIRLELAQNRLHRALAKGPSNYQAIARAELAVRRETEALTREVRQSTVAMDRAERSFSRFTRGALVGSGALGRFSRTVAFTSSTFLGGAGLAYAFKSTLDVAGQFQRELNILQAVTKASAAQMAAASEEAKRLGRDVTLPATSAKDAAQSMTELGKAGLDMTNSVAGAEGVLRLAAAAGIEVDAAAKIASRSLNAFGLAGEESTRVADVFASIANAATGEIPDFALALSQSSAVANAWGLTLEDAVATLGVLANRAIIGSDAGTSLRVMLTRLVPVSKAASDKMEELGLSAFDAAGQIKPYRQILQEYHDVLVKLPPEQQKLAIQTIFGQDAQRIANIVILKGLAAYDKLRKKVDETGAAQQLAAARNKGYVGALDAFQSAVETLQITLGTELLPHFTRALTAATEWVNEMEESGTATKELKTFIHDAAIALGILKEAFKGIKAVLDPVIEAVGGVTHALELVFGAYMLRKIGIWLGVITTSSRTAATKGAADAAVFGRAWDIATRPRTMVVTTTAPGPGPTTTRPGRFPSIPGGAKAIAGGFIVTAGALAILGDITAPPSLRRQQLEIAEMSRVDPKRAREIAREFHKSFGTPMGQLTAGNPLLQKYGDYEAVVGRQKLPTEIAAPGEGRAPAPSVRPGGRRGPRGPRGPRGEGLTPIMRAEIAAAEAVTPQQELAAERQILAIYERELKNTTLTGEKLKDLRIKVANQRETVRNIQEGIARDAQQDEDERKRNAKQRENERKRRYRERLDTQEQELRNIFDERLAEEGRKGDRAAYIKLRNALRDRVNDRNLTAKERAQAQKRLNALNKEWVASRKKENENDRDAIEEVLKNDVAAAELTEKNTRDDLKAHRRLRDQYRRWEQDDNLTREQRQKYRGLRIAEQKEINNLLKDERDLEDKIRQEMSEVLTEFAGFQHEFLTGMISQFVGGTGSGNAMQTAALEQFTLQGNRERAEQTRYLRVIAGREQRRGLDEALMA
jgi:TP901 family phage tail tape measure protein